MVAAAANKMPSDSLHARPIEALSGSPWRIAKSTTHRFVQPASVSQRTTHPEGSRRARVGEHTREAGPCARSAQQARERRVTRGRMDLSLPLAALRLAIAPSATLAVDAKAKALKAAEGRPVIIGFGAGEPDFPTPDFTVVDLICNKEPQEPPLHAQPGKPAKPLRADVRDSGYEVDRRTSSSPTAASEPSCGVRGDVVDLEAAGWWPAAAGPLLSEAILQHAVEVFSSSRIPGR